jgi:hypothetical protein
VYEGAPDFSLERVPGEFLARADAVSVEQMRVVAGRVSAALVALAIRTLSSYMGRSRSWSATCTTAGPSKGRPNQALRQTGHANKGSS